MHRAAFHLGSSTKFCKTRIGYSINKCEQTGTIANFQWELGPVGGDLVLEHKTGIL
jgi:hypothetical protein